MPLPTDLLVPLVDNSDEGYEQPLNINTQSVATAGFYPQNATSTDKNAGMYRDSSGNLVLKDANAGTKTLTELGNGGVSFGTPVAVGSANSAGTATTAARADHVHSHGDQSGGTLHATVTTGAAGFMSAADKSKLDGATNTNTVSTLVSRDASGNFSAGTITADLSGNAATATSSTTATKLSSARTFALIGDVTGSVSSDLTSGASITTTHGDLGGGSRHAVVTGTTAGFMSASDKTKLDSVTVANIPTANEKAALVGTSGNSPTTTNRFVDNLDSRLSNARAPTTHASTHASGGSDPITIAQSQVTSLTTDLAAKAADNAVVHLTGAETVAGVKTFSSSPVIPTPSNSTDAANKSYVDTLAASISGNYGAPVQDATALRAVGMSQRVDKQIRLVEDKGAIYRWDSTGTGTDDGDGTITPNDGIGRWFKVSAATQSHNGLAGLQGGTTNDYQHLTTAQVGTLTGATSASTASTLVLRDASGNFSAGTITAALSGNATTATSATSATTATNATNVSVTDDTTTATALYLALVGASSGNNPLKTTSTKLMFTPSTGVLAATAFSGPSTSAGKLTTARTFALTGDVTGTVSSDLTTGASIATTHGSLSGASMHAAATSLANGFMSSSDKSKLDASTSTSTASTLVLRDASSNFSAGTITAALSGNASTATKLQTARTINGVSFDGSANITVPANNSTLTAGSYLTGTSYNGAAAATFAVDGTTAATANKVVVRDASAYVAAAGFTFNGHTMTDPQVYNVLGSDLTIATNNTTTTIVTTDTLQPNAVYVFEIYLLMYNTSTTTTSAVNANISVSQAFQWLNHNPAYSTQSTGFLTYYLTTGSAAALMPTQPFNSHWMYTWNGVLKTHATLTSTISGTFSYGTALSNMFIARAASYTRIVRVG